MSDREVQKMTTIPATSNSVMEYPRFHLRLSVISRTAIRSIVEKDKYLQFLCVPLNYLSADNFHNRPNCNSVDRKSVELPFR